MNSGSWSFGKTFNLLSAFDYDDETFEKVVSIDLIIYGPLGHIDMYLDDVRFDYYTRDRSWVPGANLRQGSENQIDIMPSPVMVSIDPLMQDRRI